ncbi:MAG: hypothetical protein AB4911_21300 [Oscillochloridaceae bacterium umkhey_bin13]
MALREQTQFMIRPLCLADVRIIYDHKLWRKPRIRMSPLCFGVGAFTSMGEIGAYGGFFSKNGSEEARITAIQSRMPGAGTAILDALKVRTYHLIANSDCVVGLTPNARKLLRSMAA